MRHGKAADKGRGRACLSCTWTCGHWELGRQRGEGEVSRLLEKAVGSGAEWRHFLWDKLSACEAKDAWRSGEKERGWFVAGAHGAFIHETDPGICSSPIDGRERILKRLSLSWVNSGALAVTSFFSGPHPPVCSALCWSVDPSTSFFPPVLHPLQSPQSLCPARSLTCVFFLPLSFRSCACPVTWLLQPLLPGHLAHHGANPVHSWTLTVSLSRKSDHDLPAPSPPAFPENKIA